MDELTPRSKGHKFCQQAEILFAWQKVSNHFDPRLATKVKQTYVLHQKTGGSHGRVILQQLGVLLHPNLPPPFRSRIPEIDFVGFRQRFLPGGEGYRDGYNLALKHKYD